MDRLNVQPDKVYTVKYNSDELVLSNGAGDHAVRYAGELNFLDHIVSFTPVTIEGYANEEEYTELQFAQRHFLGAVAVERIVAATGLHEIYATEVTESIYEAYLEDRSYRIGDDIDEMFSE